MEDDAFRLSAALAYYALFSMAPMLIIITVLVGLVYSGDTIEQIRDQFAGIVSPEVGDLIAKGVVHAGATLSGGFGYATVAFVLLLAGASAFTHQLQNAVETMWNLGRRNDRGLCEFVKCRLGTLVLVFAAGAVLQFSVVVSSAITIYRKHLSALLAPVDFIWHWVDYGVSFAVVTAVFAFVYKLLPNAKVGWRDVFAGAVLTAVLFNAGKWAIAFYLSRSSFQSIYGAAGSLMVLLAWLYYSSLILLFGAEFTQVWVESRGRNIGERHEAA